VSATSADQMQFVLRMIVPTGKDEGIVMGIDSESPVQRSLNRFEQRLHVHCATPPVLVRFRVGSCRLPKSMLGRDEQNKARIAKVCAGIYIPVAYLETRGRPRICNLHEILRKIHVSAELSNVDAQDACAT